MVTIEVSSSLGVTMKGIVRSMRKTVEICLIKLNRRDVIYYQLLKYQLSRCVLLIVVVSE